MLDPDVVTGAVVQKLREIPALVTALGGNPASITQYIDIPPDFNSMTQAVYAQAPGTILVFWIEITLVEGDDMSWYEHVLRMYLRAPNAVSVASLIKKVKDGVPTTNGGLRFNYVPVLEGTEPPLINRISREIDSEGLDYFSIELSIRETGD